MSRTGIDFSKHELIITDNEFVNICWLKIPDRMMNNIKFINTNGILAVTGDFGNWIFCREFHPSADGYVSDGYWDEKLRIASVQQSHKFDSEQTIKDIDEFVEEHEYYFETDSDVKEEIEEWIEDLRQASDDETDYINVAYRQNPSWLDCEYVPFGKKRHTWLSIIYDAFDEICNRMKNETTNKN